MTWKSGSSTYTCFKHSKIQTADTFIGVSGQVSPMKMEPVEEGDGSPLWKRRLQMPMSSQGDLLERDFRFCIPRLSKLRAPGVGNGSRCVSVFGNAQGKTNLLEACYYLSTLSSPRVERRRSGALCSQAFVWAAD